MKKQAMGLYRSVLESVFFFLASGLLLPNVGSAAWKPTRPIQFVVQTSPGGGSDIYTRLWTGIIDKHKLSPIPLTVVNKPGGSGAVALTFLAEHKASPYYVTPTLNSIVTTPLQQKIPVMYPSRDLTPIALLTIDPFLLWVNSAKIKNWDEFHKACKERSLVAPGTGAKQEDAIQIGLIQQATDCKPFKYVPMSGGGKVAGAVAGGQMDFSVNQPAEGMPHYPQRMHPIVSFTRKRLAAFPDAPTHWELKIGTANNNEYAKLLDLETGLHQMRGIIGPPDMPKEAVAWYGDVFHKVFEAKEWQDFMKTNSMVPVFKGPDDYKKWLETFEDNHVRMMKDVFHWELRDDLKKR